MRVQQLIAWFLALSFALAGLVAISPTLHVIIEHGGNGPAHTHHGGPAVTSNTASLHDHPHPHPHVHGSANDEEEVFPRAPRRGLFISTHRSFLLFQIPVRQWSQAFSSFLGSTPGAGPVSPGSAPHGNHAGHEHHGLAQLLASGLIELSVDAPLLDFDFVRCSFTSPAPPELLLVRFLDAQTAGRAPPLTWS